MGIILSSISPPHRPNRRLFLAAWRGHKLGELSAHRNKVRELPRGTLAHFGQSRLQEQHHNTIMMGTDRRIAEY
jgi:hypothetical protein